MKKIFKITDKVCEIIAWIGIAMVVVMTVMYCIDVIGRMAFGFQIKGSFEVAQFLLCLIVFISYPYAQVKRGHIQVGIIVRKIPQKAQLFIMAGGFLISAAMCAILAYALWSQGDFSLSSNRISQVLEIPYYPLYYASAVLIGLFGVTIIFDIIKAILAIGGNEECKESLKKVFS